MSEQDRPITTGDRVTWTSRGKTYTGTVEVRVDCCETVRVLTDGGKRLFALRKQLTRLDSPIRRVVDGADLDTVLRVGDYGGVEG